MPNEPGPWKRYGLPIALVVAATALTPLLEDWLQPTPYLLFLTAAIFSAWYGGLGPGLLATITGFLVVEVLFLRWANPFDVSITRRFGLFLVLIVMLGRQSSARRRARADLRFLADAGQTLAASLDQHTTLDAVARLGALRLADACLVCLREETGALPLAAVAAASPAVASALRALAPPAAEIGPSSDPLAGPPEALLPRLASDPTVRSRLAALSLREVAILPLRARGHTLGSLVLFRLRRWPRWQRSDLALAGELAHRAALALDNARLYGAALRMKEALRQRNEELAAADKRKDLFLAVLGHEMSGPLSALSHLAALWEASPERLPPGAGDLMGRQLDLLRRLAADLLDVARIAQGKLELRRAPVPLADIVADAVAAVRALMADRRHELSIVLPPEPIWLEADRVRLAQVLINLLTNAARYTEPGGRISLTAEPADGEVLLRLRDTGVGIAPELLPRIFDLFTQGESSNGGLGLGLALVRRLVEMHGGQVAAHSDGPGHGSEFRLRLPTCAPLALPPPTPLSDRFEPRSSAPVRRILVVDDNADTAETLARLLELGGHPVGLAHDGPTALRVAETFRPEVVLLDIGLPEMDGYEVAGRLRQLPGLEQTVLVALTGYSHDEHRRRCREVGFDHILTKPIDPEDLQQLLATGPGYDPLARPGAPEGAGPDVASPDLPR